MKNNPLNNMIMLEISEIKEIKNNLVDSMIMSEENKIKYNVVDSEQNIVQSNVMSEENYRKKILAKSKGHIIWSRYDDYDSDGNCEMFALISSEEKSYDTLYGELWFANLNQVYKLEDYYDYYRKPQMYTFKENSFIAFEVVSVTDSLTLLWGVQNGEPFQPSLTSKGNGFSVNDYNEAVLTDSCYGFLKTVYDNEPDNEIWTGHTWNPYFYYWDGKSFREYGAIEITIDELLQIEGADELLNYVRNQGATVNEIYYRNNNIIQINFQNKEREDNHINTFYRNIMVRYNGEKIELDKSSIGEGNFSKALNSSLAEYPTKFNIDNYN